MNPIKFNIFCLFYRHYKRNFKEILHGKWKRHARFTTVPLKPFSDQQS